MEPITRSEKILNGEDLEPITRMEYFLKKAAQGGGDGGGASGLFVEFTYDEQDDVYRLSKNYKEINNAIQNGVIPAVVMLQANGEYLRFDIVSWGYLNGYYKVSVISLEDVSGGTATFTAATDTDTLVMESNE